MCIPKLPLFLGLLSLAGMPLAGQTMVVSPTRVINVDGSVTWGRGLTDTWVWTFNRATGSDPTITIGDGVITLPSLLLTTDLALTEIASIADNRILGNVSGGALAPAALEPADVMTMMQSAGTDVLTAAERAGVAYGSAVANGATMTLADSHQHRRFVSATFTGTTATISLSSTTPSAIGAYITVRLLNTNGGGDLVVSIPNGLINPNRDPDTATSSTTITFATSSAGVGFITFASGDGSTWNEYYVAGDTFDGYASQTATLTNKTLNGNTWNDGTVDLDGGVFEFPNGNDPDISTAGQAAFDLNGNWLRGYDGTNQFALGQKIHSIQFTVVLPNDLADSERDAFWIWENVTGMSFVVTGWSFKSDTDDTTLNIEEIDNDGANNATVDAVEIATNGTGLFYASDTTITAATIETGHVLVIDFDDTDTPGQVKGVIYGYFDANVN